MTDLKKRGEELNAWCDFAGKATHQIGLLLVIVVGSVVAVISTTAVSVLGVLDLWHRLTR
jgi:hypothetical protein